MQLPAVLLQYNLFAWLYQVQLAACYFKNMQFFICKNKLPKNPWKSQTKFSFYSYTSSFTTWQSFIVLLEWFSQYSKKGSDRITHFITSLSQSKKRTKETSAFPSIVLFQPWRLSSFLGNPSIKNLFFWELAAIVWSIAW